MHLSMEPLNCQIRLFTKEDVVDEVNDLNIFNYAPINENWWGFFIIKYSNLYLNTF
jgi:hypothetical protein